MSWRRESHRFNIETSFCLRIRLPQQCTAAISETSGYDQWDDPLSLIDPRWRHRPEWLPARKALRQRALEPQKGWCHYLTAHLIAQLLNTAQWNNIILRSVHTINTVLTYLIHGNDVSFAIMNNNDALVIKLTLNLTSTWLF